MEKTERNSSIELLRILAALGVILLHYNNANIGGALYYVEKGSINDLLLKFTQSTFICAVNIFIIISGYYLSSTKERKLSKLIELALEISIIRLVIYLINCAINKSFSIVYLLFYLVPNNWFFVLYSILYILSPYINLIIEKLNKKQLRNMIIILFIIFSVYSFAIDFVMSICNFMNIDVNINGISPIGINGSQEGYTIINFVLMYLIGSYIKNSDLIISNKKLTFIISILIFVEFILLNITSVFNNYNNPLVILIAAFIFILFNNKNYKNKFINELAKASFTSLILNEKLLKITNTKSIVNQNIFILLLHLIVTSIIIYIISYIAYKLYSLIINPIRKRMYKTINRINIYKF